MVNQYEIYWVDLNPTFGSEINKMRPCVMLTPNASNSRLNTVLVAPVTSTIRLFPVRLKITLSNRQAHICPDQIRYVNKLRLGKKMEFLNHDEIFALKSLLQEYLIG